MKLEKIAKEASVALRAVFDPASGEAPKSLLLCDLGRPCLTSLR
jgi:hypothetical protein